MQPYDASSLANVAFENLLPIKQWDIITGIKGFSLEKAEWTSLIGYTYTFK